MTFWLDMFINIIHICVFPENWKKKLWITSVYAWTLGIKISHTEGNHGYANILIQGRVMLKNNSFYFLAICVNFPCKIEKLELEVVGMGILGTGFCFR